MFEVSGNISMIVRISIEPEQPEGRVLHLTGPSLDMTPVLEASYQVPSVRVVAVCDNNKRHLSGRDWQGDSL